MSALGAKALSEFEFLAGPAGERQVPECLSAGKVRRGSELLGCKAQEPALQRYGLGREPGNVDGKAVELAARPPPRTGRP